MSAPSPVHPTVREVTLDLMRALGLTTVFGNPGSTELGFLGGWPDDLRYVLALQEASAVGMADGFAQASGGPAFVNLHSAAGLGNALGNIFTAFRNQTPLVITAGQQARSLLLREPYLGAHRATEFPLPYVKWSCEPARAQDVPAALEQAYFQALQRPCGPTFVSIPSDDWEAPSPPVRARTIRRDFAPDPEAVTDLVAAIGRSRNPVLVVGSAIDREGAFELAVAVAERMGAVVWEAPTSSRANFPEDHPLFAGFLPAVPEKLSRALDGHDLVLVVGAPVFTLHVPGELAVAAGDRPIYQVTDDPASAACAYGATSIIATMRLFLSALLARLPDARGRASVARTIRDVEPSDPLHIDYVMQTLSRRMPPDAVLVEEAPSHRPAMQTFLPIRRGEAFYTMASGGLGYGLPAAVGIALHRDVRTVCLVGDGSAMYSIQAIWTAVQHRLPVTVVVLNNEGYGAMRAFSRLLQIGQPPGIDLPGIDFVALGQSLGCPGRSVARAEDLGSALGQAFAGAGPNLVEVAIDPGTGDIY